MIGFIIQARTESTRYPNKIVLPFFNKESIITLLIEKLKSNFNLPIILATSTNSSNDILEKIAINKGVKCFRGSENDVLQRFIDAAEQNKITRIIRVCSDNPFLDVDRINLLIDFFNKSDNLDYTSFQVNNSPSIKTHFGFWVEIVSLDALKKVKNHTTEEFYFEHVTNYIYANPDKFNIKWVIEKLELNPSIRMTIDTKEDFNTCKGIFKLYTKNNWKLSQLIDYLDNNPEVLSTMEKQIVANSK
jgi:spore coat polysaccharide biosynthesis protein SpsF (cytidylyltransferase family)